MRAKKQNKKAPKGLVNVSDFAGFPQLSGSIEREQ
jgi:hypothetical protein